MLLAWNAQPVCGAGALARVSRINLITSHRDQRHLQSLERSQQAKNLFSLATSRKSHYCIPANDHSEVSMNSFYRMHEQRRRSSRIQSSRNLACNDAAFAHASDHNSTIAAVK